MDKEILSNQIPPGNGTNASEIPMQKEVEGFIKSSLNRVDSEEGSSDVILEKHSLDSSSINPGSLNSQSDDLSGNEVSNHISSNIGTIDLSVEELMRQARKLQNKNKKLMKRRKRRIEKSKQGSVPVSGRKNKRDKIVRLNLLPRGKNQSSHSTLRCENSDNFSLSKFKDFQVVVMPEDGSKLSKSKIKTIGPELIIAIDESTIDSDGNPMGPQLQYLNVCKVKEGWLLITCFNKETMDWTLNWKPKDNGLKIIPYSTAPVRIAICIKATEVNLDEVSRVLQAQNRNVKVENWRHIITQQNMPGFWKVVFTVPLDIASLLVRQNLKLAYKTSVLKVTIISSRVLEDVTAAAEEGK